jgi:hypothetical protein
MGPPIVSSQRPATELVTERRWTSTIHGAAPHPGMPEPRFTERLVERALKTGAEISPIEGAADGGPRNAVGIAALLRW